jgi:metal-sulfur cluster biosynthetic enzyme
MGPAIAHDAQSKILTIDGIDEADVQLVWDPPWNQSMLSEAAKLQLGLM